MELQQRHRRADLDPRSMGREFGRGRHVEMANDNQIDVGPLGEEVGQRRGDRGEVTVVRRRAAGKADAEPAVAGGGLRIPSRFESRGEHCGGEPVAENVDPGHDHGGGRRQARRRHDTGVALGDRPAVECGGGEP